MFKRFTGAHDRFDILQLRAADRLRPRPPLPAPLVEVPRLDPDAAASGPRTAAGRPADQRSVDGPRRIDFAVPVRSVEIWRVSNIDAVQHNFHLHDVQFQVLAGDGAAPPPELAGWKDTVFCHPAPSWS